MRIICFIGIIILSLIFPLYVFVALSALYSIRWFGVELLFLAMAIDAYFGAAHAPWYIIATVCTLVIIEWLKPTFSFHTG